MDVKEILLAVDPSSVMYSSISKSKGGYNTASISIKAGLGEYISISYDWEGDVIPDFVLNIIGVMTANNLGLNKVVAGMEQEYASYTKVKEESK